MSESDWVRGYVQGFVHAVDLIVEDPDGIQSARRAIDGLKNQIKEQYPSEDEKRLP